MSGWVGGQPSMFFSSSALPHSPLKPPKSVDCIKVKSIAAISQLFNPGHYQNIVTELRGISGEERDWMGSRAERERGEIDLEAVAFGLCG